MNRRIEQIQETHNFMWNTKDALGQGATGHVYKARHKKNGDMYAVKTFNANSFDRPGNVQKREFEILSRLDHRNIAKMLAVEVVKSLGDKVIVMELCAGGSLYSILQDEPENAFGLPEEEFLAVLRDVTNGVEYLHGQKIAHRDIKPGNILRYITEDGRSVYKLTDFGAARELQEGEQFMSLYGTEEYLHPDMYEKAVLKKSKGKSFKNTVDLWSLGVTFYHVATGQLPFKPFGGRSNKETMYQMIAEKEPGVISGAQKIRGGPIEWRRQLPSACIQSVGLQDIITPMFAALLETDEEKRWTFSQLFEYVSSIQEKSVVHVFSVPLASSMRIYINGSDSFATFQELIAQQTDIPAGQQLLLFNNDTFANIISQTQPARTYPPTDIDNPIFLLPNGYYEFSKLPNHIVPSLPKLDLSQVKYDHDSLIVKMFCEVLYLARNELKNCLRKERHLKNGVKMLIHHYSAKIQTLCSILKELQTRERVQTQQLVTLETCHGRETALLHLVNKQFTDLPEDVVISEFQLDEMIENTNSTSKEVQRLLIQTAEEVNDCYTKYVTKKGLEENWSNRDGIAEGDNSLMVLDQLVKAVHKTSDEFKIHASHPRMSSNDEQIHQFEKQKVDHRCRKGMKLFVTVFTKLKDVYNKLPDWFLSVNAFCEKYKKADCLTQRLADTIDGFSSKLDTTAEQYSEMMAKILQRLQEESVEHPVDHNTSMNQSSLESRVSNVSPPKSSDSWMCSVELEGVKLPMKQEETERRAEKVQELCDSLKSLGESSAEVKSAIDENKKLIEGLNLLKMSSGSGDDFSPQI